jgi:hypothetical protein
MANTYTWSITKLERYPTYADQTDVVFRIQYACVASDSGNPATLAGHTAFIDVPYATGEFIPYASLTSDICLAWVKEVLGPAKIQQLYTWLDLKISDIKNPTVLENPPWA